MSVCSVGIYREQIYLLNEAAYLSANSLLTSLIVMTLKLGYKMPSYSRCSLITTQSTWSTLNHSFNDDWGHFSPEELIEAHESKLSPHQWRDFFNLFFKDYIADPHWISTTNRSAIVRVTQFSALPPSQIRLNHTPGSHERWVMKGSNERSKQVQT